jgi:drug/metabolite transporter (DMT)-like permease
VTRAPGVSKWLPSYILLALIWGGSFAFMMIGLESLTPVGVSFGRILLGAITLLVLAAATRTSLPPRRAWKHLFIYAALVSTVPWTMFAIGETHISSALAGIINGATPLMTLVAILAAFPEETPNRQRIIGLSIGFIGVLIVVGVWQGLAAGTWTGIAACFVAIICYGISYPYGRRHLTGGPLASDLTPLALATGVLVMATIQTAPLTLITGVFKAPLQLSTVIAMLCLGCLGSGVAYVLNFRVLANSDATTASTVTYIPPLIAVIVGAIFLDEHLTWNQPIGGVLVVAGAAIAQGVLHLPKRSKVRSERDSETIGEP